MKKIPIVGNAGVNGWAIEPDDQRAYFEHMARHWEFLSGLWYWFRPPNTAYRIAYSRPDGGVSVVTPTPWMMTMLKRGDVIRHMRQVDSFGPQGIPVFEGSGEFLPPMTEREAIEFIAWRDIPRAINHRMILSEGDIPRDRSRRNDWRLSDSGIVVV